MQLLEDEVKGSRLVLRNSVVLKFSLSCSHKAGSFETRGVSREE